MSFHLQFKSVKQDWVTPDNLFNKLNYEFNFNFDLAATKENTKCEQFYTKEQDALKQNWNGICWLNPPYGDKSSRMIDWIKKAYNDSQNNSNLIVVMLIPARTNTKWFHQYCMKSAEIKFICGRPKFEGAKHGLPWPLCLVVFKKSDQTKFTSFYL